jgi:hypothetical protein
MQAPPTSSVGGACFSMASRRAAGPSVPVGSRLACSIGTDLHLRGGAAALSAVAGGFLMAARKPSWRHEKAFVRVREGLRVGVGALGLEFLNAVGLGFECVRF